MDNSNETLVSNIQAGINRQENIEKLWVQNKGLTYKIINKYKSVVEAQDIMQECFIAMCKAIESYDINAGCLFSGWFFRIAQQTIRRYYNENCAVIRLPEHLQVDIWKYKDIVNRYEKEENRKPSDIELMAEMGCSSEKLEKIIHAAMTRNIDSLDAPLPNTEDESITLEDTLTDATDDFEAFIKKYDHNIMATDLHEKIESLPANQKDSINGAYFEGKTRTEVGKVLGVTGSRVGSNIAAGFRKIRNTDYKRNLKGYYENYLDPYHIRHVTKAQFDRNWTSEQEYAVIRQEQAQERRERQAKENYEYFERMKARKEKEEAEELARQVARKKRIEVFNKRQEILWKTDPEQAEREWKERVEELLKL